jgi:hypothetical protein
MKKKVSLKKLSLNKEKVVVLDKKEQAKVKGGFFGSRFICTQTKSEVGCTSHTACNKSPERDSVVILCID